MQGFMHRPLGPQRLRLRLRPALVAATCLLVGCGTLDPHIFSDRITEPASTGAKRDSAVLKDTATTQSAPVTLDSAYADASQAQQRYLTAVARQGNAMPKLSAALIGLSAASLFKGMTSPNTKDLAGAGVLGGAGWAYGSTHISRSRLDVYRAGAEALSCAMTAVEPLRIGRTQLGTPQDGSEQRTLYGALLRMEMQRQAVQQLLDKYGALRQPETIVERRSTKGSPPRLAPRRENCDAIQDPSPARRRALVEECNARPPRSVAARPPTRAPAGPASREVEPPLSLLRAFDAADREIARAEGSEQSAEAAIKALAAAGPTLWHKSLRIQLAVSAEVDKTIPDPASVLSAAKGIPAVASAISGLDFAALAVKPSAARGDAQGTTDRRPLGLNDRTVQAELLAASAALARARIALDALIHPFTGVTDTGLREAINACSVRTTGIELKVSPAGDEIAVAPGGSAVFFVSGGSGAPSAQVVVGPKSEVPMRPEGGQFRFEYTPPVGLQPGEVVVLRFTDGSGSASHFVLLRIVAAPAPRNPDGDKPNPPGGNATPPVPGASAPAGSGRADVSRPSP